MEDSNKTSYPILQLEICAASDADKERLQAALEGVAGPRSNVRVMKRSNDGIFLVQGRDKSDIEAICDRLRDEFNLAVNVGLLEPVLIKRIRKPAEGEGKFIRQTGGKGNYGHCSLGVEPLESGKGIQFINELTSDVIPSEFITPIEEGVRLGIQLELLESLQVVDVKVTLRDGSFHETDSNEMAFKLAAAAAFKDAIKKASPILLEPMMALEIEVPSGLKTAVRSEVLAHRGRVERERNMDGFCEVEAIVPLAELLVRSPMTIAEFPMAFAGYEPIRDDGASNDNDLGVVANNPDRPRTGPISASVQPNPED